MLFDPAFFRQIKGFLNHHEGVALYRLARKASRKAPCLEIGSYCGKSAVYLGLGCQENNAVLFSIDHHGGSEEHQPGGAYFDPSVYNRELQQVDTFPHFRQTILKSGLKNTIVPIVCSSQVAVRQWKTPLGLVFIDGGHSYESAFADYTAWSKFILPGGYLLIHDIYQDPQQGGQAPFQIYQQALASGRYKALPMIESIGILLHQP
jgi:predicted O-methyltransferase YrrM